MLALGLWGVWGILGKVASQHLPPNKFIRWASQGIWWRRVTSRREGWGAAWLLSK